MGKEYSVQEALKLAIESEKESLDFYRKAAALTRNDRARQVFTLLEKEEGDHLRAFFHYYKGNDFGDVEAYIASPASPSNAAHRELEKALSEDVHEQRAMEIALKEEKATIDQYSLFARDIVDPLVRSIFERVVKETQKHYDLIEAEYSHVMTMVHPSDQDIYVRE